MGTAGEPYYPWDNKKIQDPDSPSDGFNVVHPDRGAESIPCVSITHGLNADFTALPETAYIRCRKCGFILNTARHPKGWGTGVTFDWSNVLEHDGWGGGAWGAGYESMAADPVVTAGCPLCGTFIYD